VACCGRALARPILNGLRGFLADCAFRKARRRRSRWPRGAVLSHQRARCRPAVVPPARIVTASADNTARIWDAVTGAALATSGSGCQTPAPDITGRRHGRCPARELGAFDPLAIVRAMPGAIARGLCLAGEAKAAFMAFPKLK
jgi:hypothetical protein